MWIMTQSGFVSVVQKGGKDVMMARGRDRESLEAITNALGLKATRVYTDWPSDYPFRLRLTREQLVRFLSCTVEDLTYSNFKDRITKTRGKTWHDALMNVWVAMLAVTPSSVNKSIDQSWRRRRNSRWDQEEAAREPETGSGLHRMTDAEWRRLMEEEPSH